MNILKVESGTNPVCMGYSTSSQRLCTRHQRPRHTLLPSLPVRIHWFAYSKSICTFVLISASTDSDPEQFNPAILPKNVFDAIEADSFWCLSRLLDGIQDNYIFAQPGIQRSVRKMADLVARIDSERLIVSLILF